MTNKKFILFLILMLAIPVFVFAADFLYGKKLDKEVEQRTQNMKNNTIIQLFLEQYPNAIFEVLPHGQSDAVFADEEREFYIDYIHETQQIYLYCIDRSDDLNLKTVFEETDEQKIRERILNKECQ
jgi:hypothetical protein